MESYEVNDISEYISKILEIKQIEEKGKNNNELLFRGQIKDESKWELKPKINRLKLKAGNITEKLMLEEFSRALPLVSQNIDLNNYWQVITLAQHYGLPTRFLDWSYSCLAALYFAVNNNYKKGFVYILIAKDLKIWNETKNEKTIDPLDIEKIMLYRPIAVSERVKVQDSVFTVHPVDKSGVTFETSPQFKIVKIIVKNAHKVQKQLNILGVNAYSIIPDLDGLYQKLQWRFCK